MNRDYFIIVPHNGDWHPVARKAFIGSTWEWPIVGNPADTNLAARFADCEEAVKAARHLVGTGATSAARICAELLAIAPTGPRRLALLELKNADPVKEAPAEGQPQDFVAEA